MTNDGSERVRGKKAEDEMDLTIVATAAASLATVMSGLWAVGHGMRTASRQRAKEAELASKERQRQHEEGLLRFERITNQLSSLRQMGEEAARNHAEMRRDFAVLGERIQQLDRRVAVLESQARPGNK